MTDLLVMKATPYWPTKLIAETKVHGGKTYLARRIFQAAPKHYTGYIDGFMGAGSMTYNAPKGLLTHLAIEKNWSRWNVKTVVKHKPDELIKLLRTFDYNEATFTKCRRQHLIVEQTVRTHKDIDLKGLVDHVYAAAIYIVTNRMSRGGLGNAFAWSDRLRGKTRPGGAVPGDLNAWNTMIDRMNWLSGRLRDVELIHGRFEEHLKHIYEAVTPSEWFVYLDPPYLPIVRATNATEYGEDEMTPVQHVELLVDVLECKGMNFAISSYRNDVYDSVLKGWRRLDFDMPNHSGQSKTKERRIECLYLSY